MYETTSPSRIFEVSQSYRPWHTVSSRHSLHRHNYSTHKHPRVKAWLARNPHFHLHFIPTSSSWLNLVERWFGQITSERIRRGVFKSVDELEQAIMDYIEHNNANPKPFTWTKSANDIILKVNRGRAALNMPPLKRPSQGGSEL